jgi:hypothetical protein
MRQSLRRLKTPAQLSEWTHDRLNIYALAAAGAIGMGVLVSPQSSEGEVVYTPANVKLGRDTPVRVDLNHDGVTDFFLLEVPLHVPEGWGFSACHSIFNNGSGMYCVTSSANNSNAVRATESMNRPFGAALPDGAKISSGDHFRRKHAVQLGSVIFSSTNNGYPYRWYGPWMDRGKGVRDRYLGLEFKLQGEMHFGWARITVSTSTNPFTVRLTGYAYETVPNKPIIAGKTKGPDVVSEQPDSSPGSLGDLALGRK